MDYSKITLGEMLSNTNETIRRNALSILKTYQRAEKKDTIPCEQCGNDTTITYTIQNGCAILMSEHCHECGYEWKRNTNTQ